MNPQKLLWPIFVCKVRQSVPVGMKLELDMWQHLVDLYTKFQIDISKHGEKSPKNLKKSKNNRQNSENKLLQTTELMSGCI